MNESREPLIVKRDIGLSEGVAIMLKNQELYSQGLPTMDTLSQGREWYEKFKKGEVT